MATNTIVNRAASAPLQSTAYERFAGGSAILTGIAGFLYAVAFIVLRDTLLSALFLLLNGLLSTAALVAVYRRLRATDADFALWALLLGLVGGLGATIHGGYDLANALNPSDAAASAVALPSAIDPRGLLTFGMAGISLFVVAWLIRRGRHLPIGLSYLGYLSALLLIILYVGRLVILNPGHPIILGPALLNGFLVTPAWYIWLGMVLWRGREP
jgi:hypothetical protein